MEKTKITLQLPFISLAPILGMVTKTTESMQTFFSSALSGMTSEAPTSKSHFGARKFKRFFKNSFFLPLLIVIVIIAILFSVSVKRLLSHASSPNTDGRVTIQQAVATQPINKSFTFPLKDASGKQVSTIKYEVQSAELRNQIIVKGTPATAVTGRTFLIINLKIENGYSKSVQINSRDYLRLLMNGSSEKLAADIHNDPIEVQAISTKYTRLGFAISDTDKNLLLQVGEITGDKQTIKLTLKK